MEKSAQTPNLLEVVASYNHLRVEDYQRTYAWQKEQIDEFLLDLNESTTTTDSHFLGTLILQESENRSATVVDGQQRLTTVFITVAAMRDQLRKFSTSTIKAKNTNERDVNVVEKALDFLCYSRKLDDYRYDSSRFLRKIMKSCVLAEPEKQTPVPTRDNLGKKVTLDFRKAILHIRNWLATDLENYPNEIDKLVRIDNLLSALLDRFIVLKVTTTTLNESLDIFLTLNNRGLPLGPSDLVRGEVMSILSSGLEEDQQLKLHRQILEEWTSIVDQVVEPETFLRHYLVSTTKTKVQKKKVVKEVSTRLFDSNHEIKKAKAEEFWKALIEASLIYGSIVAPRLKGEPEYQMELMEGLGKSHRILLLAVLSKNLDEAAKNRIVKLIFVLAFRNVMAGLNAQKLEDYYQDQAFQFRTDGDVERLCSSVEARIATIEVNSLKYLTSDGDSGFIGRAVLHVVNRATTQGAILESVGSSNSHLEHVAPQTENDFWGTALFGKDDEARKQYDEVISQIGNLTLLDKGLNGRAQRLPFEDKKAFYKNSVFGISRELCEIDEWNLTIIKERTKWLSEMFDIYWSVKQTDRKIQNFSVWVKSDGIK
jgi:hypothetical protein